MIHEPRSRVRRRLLLGTLAVAAVMVTLAAGIREHWSGTARISIAVIVKNRDDQTPVQDAYVSIEQAVESYCHCDNWELRTDSNGTALFALYCPVDGESFLFGLSGSREFRPPTFEVKVSKEGFLSPSPLYELQVSSSPGVKRNELQISLVPIDNRNP